MLTPLAAKENRLVLQDDLQGWSARPKWGIAIPGSANPLGFGQPAIVQMQILETFQDAFPHGIGDSLLVPDIDRDAPGLRTLPAGTRFTGHPAGVADFFDNGIGKEFRFYTLFLFRSQLTDQAV